MTKDILLYLKENGASLSKGQRAIANYIAESYEKAAFLTAGRLGRAAGVSESTVVRFAMELGYDGYPSMQKDLQELVLKKINSVQRIEVAQDRLGDQDVVRTVLEADAEKLRKTQESLDREAFDGAVDAVLRARRIYILGVRSSAALAFFLRYYLQYMLNNVRLVTAAGPGEMCEQLVGVGPEDTVLALSFPRYSAATSQGVRFCRERGASIVGITDSGESPVGRNSDYVLTAKSDMVSLVDSLVAPLSVINALLVAIAARRNGELTGTFADLERIWERYEVYDSPEGGQRDAL